ncbi:MAG: sulfatase-like hydrolase/transferase [Planctomycetes bacterium]|nr:sulfatase-like hydrolase/transferase [Planctomycetota bacterium]
MFLTFRRSIPMIIAIVAITAPCPAKEAPRPNVLIIYTDDQGSVDLNCYGAKDLITPNLDKLAARGVRFTQMYAPSAICSASRAGLNTGRIPPRAGVPGNVSSTRGVPGMPTEEVTIAEMLKAAGYTTGHVGKWHLGYTPETMPNGQGFDYSFGHMGGCIDNYSHFFYWQGPNRHDLWRNGEEIWEDGRFFPDLMAEECIEFIEKNKSQPFFLYWAINVPHYPLQGTEKWRKAYRDMPAPRNMYAAFVSTMDERIGWVLDKLDELELSDQTLVIFQSDHGHSTEDRTFGGGGSAGPYRGAKGCLFEGGLRIPSIVSLPGVIPQGEVRGQLAVGCDWMPTIGQFCRVSLPKRKLDGKSLHGVILSPEAPSPHEQFYWQLGRGGGAQWVVRQGDWKLLGNPRDNSGPRVGGKPANLGPDDKLFLVNLAEDIGETTNLAKEQPEVLRRLKKIRDQYAQEIDG